MERRIFGIETEYGVTCTFKGQRRLSPDEVARYLFRRVVSWGTATGHLAGCGRTGVGWDTPSAMGTRHWCKRTPSSALLFIM